MREWVAQEKEKTVQERKERDILIEGVTKGLSRNTALGKFPGTSRKTPTMILSNNGKDAYIGILL